MPRCATMCHDVPMLGYRMIQNHRASVRMEPWMLWMLGNGYLESEGF